ncbi:MAG TPA: hypothetical protein VKQ70_10590 [Caulobacteraceae bacterium]|jgi:hypothetical protein|nr:hypothetical protein [Caulobacteraceae bacterium]
MKLCSAARFYFAIAAGLLAVSTAAPALAKKPPPPMIVPPPMPPPMPDVGLGARFVDDAAVYETYVTQASAISPAFADAQGVADSLRVGVAYEPGQLRRGAIAYAAAAALDDATFVDDVRKAGATPEARYAIVAKLFADPKNVLAFVDARGAAALAKAALADSGLRVFDAGDRVRLAAYSIQHQPWSLTPVADLSGRAAAVKQLSGAFRQPSSQAHTDVDRMILGEPATAPMAAPPPYSPLVIRAVALAALAAIGQAGNDDVAHLGWLTDDYYLDHCLAEAKLSLYECIAVAKPNYEDVFCLGQHALKDTGGCVVKSAWSTVPVDVMTHDMTIPAARIHKAPTRKRRRT